MNMLQRHIAAAKKKEGGFTLVELLIVIVILGILAAVVVFSVGGITDRGKKSACEASRSSILTASESAFAVTGTRPATVALLESGGFLNLGQATFAGNVVSGGATGNTWSLTYVPGTPPAPATVTGSCA